MEEPIDEQHAQFRTLRTTPIEDVIAEQKLIAMVGTERREIVLQVGRPYDVGDGVAQTPVASWGLDGRCDLFGGDTFQSLNIACRFLEMRLVDDVRSGLIKLFDPDDAEQEIAAEDLCVLFGTVRTRHGMSPKPSESDDGCNGEGDESDE